MLHGACVGGKAGARNLMIFRVKWLRPAMEATFRVRQVQLGPFRPRSVPPLCSAMSGCYCVGDLVADRNVMAA